MRFVQFHFAVSLARFARALTWPPMSPGEMVFSSMKMTPPWLRCSSAQALSSGGIVLRSYVTRVNPRVAACSRHAESSSPKNRPFSQSTMQWTVNDRWRRRRPTATLGEICSSRRSLSISGFPYPSGTEAGDSGQHTLERSQVRGGVFRQRFFDFPVECLSIIDCSLDLGFWPLQMLRHGGNIPLIRADDQEYLPYRKCAPLDIGLPAGR